jgi:LacI family transcriptional regulator
MVRKRVSRSIKPVTIRDVADAAGVSVGTVSKALNDSGQLRGETRDTVRRIAERLRFRPNEMARSLSGQQRSTVGLISTDRHGRFSIPVLEGIEDALDAANISVFLCNAGGDPQREQKHVRSLLAKRVDGVIVTGGRSAARPRLDLDGEDVPVVYAFARVDDPAALCVQPDDHGGGRIAGEHLVRLGRRRIAHVTGWPDVEAVQHRHAGLAAELAANGLDLDPGLVLTGPWSEVWGREAARRLVAMRAPIDAIFCGSDQIARGVIDQLAASGRRVPADIAIVGFDNWEIMATATQPPLTTIDMNLHELGRQAGLRLLAMLDGESVAPGMVRLPCTLIVRGSCGGADPGK